MKKPPTIEFAQRAERDLRKLRRPELRRLRDALASAATGNPNADVKVIAGRRPWLRLRVGNNRVIYRPLTASGGALGRFGHPRGAS